MKRHGYVIKFALFIIIFLSIVQVVVSNRLSTAGMALGKIEDEIRFYKRENASLSEEFFLASSLANISSKAAEMGFIGNKSQLVLTTSDLVLKTSLPFALSQ
jgi:hypothetical protein